jgi:hypothetical protein
VARVAVAGEAGRVCRSGPRRKEKCFDFLNSISKQHRSRMKKGKYLRASEKYETFSGGTLEHLEKRLCWSLELDRNGFWIKIQK